MRKKAHIHIVHGFHLKQIISENTTKIKLYKHIEQTKQKKIKREMMKCVLLGSVLLGRTANCDFIATQSWGRDVFFCCFVFLSCSIVMFIAVLHIKLCA